MSSVPARPFAIRPDSIRGLRIDQLRRQHVLLPHAIDAGSKQRLDAFAHRNLAPDLPVDTGGVGPAHALQRFIDA